MSPIPKSRLTARCCDEAANRGVAKRRFALMAGAAPRAVDERKIAREAFMRIALPHLAFELSPPRFASWRSEFNSWRRRARERDELARMSDGELHDIGVTSAERWAEIKKPCWRG
jgi:uncharacterized protein YjiS (DUF1127 family)